MLIMLVGVIPVVGLIVYIIWAINERNVNVRNYARAAIIWMLIGIVLCTLFWGIIFAAIGSLGDSYY